MIEKYVYTKEFKTEYLGEGEWVEEADYVEFNYCGYECHIDRIIASDFYRVIPTGFWKHAYFGGHLCGYVLLHKEHPCFGKDYDDIDITCHGGLTYGVKISEISYKIGFDCGHCCDYVPTIEKLKKDFGVMSKIPEPLKNSLLFNTTYKNMNFCIQECKSMVDQLIVIANEQDEK